MKKLVSFLFCFVIGWAVTFGGTYYDYAYTYPYYRPPVVYRCYPVVTPLYPGYGWYGHWPWYYGASYYNYHHRHHHHRHHHHHHHHHHYHDDW